MAIHGAGRHMERLRRMQRSADERLGRAVYVAADMLRTEARHLITAGSISGKGHVPSRPGEPPNQDTGVLAGRIEVQRVTELHARVVSGAPYAAFLEWGTSKMAERPYMRPATKKVAPEMLKLVRVEIRRLTRES